MSYTLFLGRKTPLEKTFYTAQEIYAELRYPDSLYATEGIFFGEPNLFEKNFLEGALPGVHWYEIQGMVLPFCCKSKVKDVLPDFYEASLQLNRWFLTFLKLQLADEDIWLLRLWMGAKRTIRRGRLDLAELTAEDAELPVNTAVQLFQSKT